MLRCVALRFRDLKVPRSYTIEASLAGSDAGMNKGLHFSTTNLERMGHDLCAAVHDLVCEDCQFVVVLWPVF